MAWAEANAWLAANATVEAEVEDLDAGVDAETDRSPAQPAVAAPPAAETPPRRRSRPLADLVQDPALEAELAQWQDDSHVQQVAMRILAAAHHQPSADFERWLHGLPELWSLELRPRVGQAIADRFARDGLAVSDTAFDTLIACFCNEDDGAFRHALWTGRVLAVALKQSPEFLADWLAPRLIPLPYEEHAAIGAHVLRALREQDTSPSLETLDALSKAFRWEQFELDRDDRAWLTETRKAARAQARVQRRCAALAPGGDTAVLAYELETENWQPMTAQWAETLRARVVGPPLRWGCLLSALPPARPAWMYRFCGIIDRWFPDGLPASLQPRHVRFWRQVGDPRRPHGWQLTLGLARGLAVAAMLAIGTLVMLPIAGAAASAWLFGAIGTGLAIWSVGVLVQFAARWQASIRRMSRSKRIAHAWLLPVASLLVLAGMRSGGMGVAGGAALAYIALFRLTRRMDADAQLMVLAIASCVVLGSLLALVVQAGAWPGAIFALLVWPVTLIQDAQHHRLQEHR
ncbi:hypothetical protein [Xanthomonas maliensis]|uniref:hypothetical protein n=1 Tax=Xanthomonas maliensis TaxID=1321368 RepID=UPI001BA7701C|nr:hypothetical protein [Xanthomonas maliensis]